jgi:hypothetical protein
VAELGERLHLSIPMLSVSKPFQSYYKKARVGRAVQLDESLFQEFVAAMRIDIAGETKPLQLLKLEDCLLAMEVLVAAAQPVLDSVVVAVYLKVVDKQSTLVRGFLRRWFLNPSLLVQVKPLLSPEVSVPSSSTPTVKEDGLEGAPSLLGGCVTSTAEKGEDFRMNGLIQSQKWPVGFGPVREIVVWDQGDKVWGGEDGDSPYPLGVFHSDMPLDWALDGNEDEDPSLAILDAIEEDFHREAIVAHPKNKGRRELLNMKSSIDYGDASALT